MKAVGVFPGSRKIKLVRQARPTMTTPTEVKLRMLEVGICGTDREICAFDYGTPPAGSDHMVIGHESLGEVVEVGADVSRLQPGDLVVTMVRRPCPHDHCIPCRAGRQDFCDTGDFRELGIKEANGFMTEYVVEDECFMYPVPRQYRDVMVLVEPLTIAEKALSQLWQVQQRLPWACPVIPGQAPGVCHRAVVLGAGPVGLLGAMALRASGFETYVYSREPVNSPKGRIVEAIGATYVSGASETIEQLAKQVGNIDVVYEAAGASAVCFELMKYLGVNGIFVFTGVPGRKAPVQVDTDRIMRNLVLKNQVVFGTVNAGADAYEAAIRDLSQFMELWPDAVRSLITGHYPIEAYPELLLGTPSGIKNVLALDGNV
jgi:threonine dehydrogenase-like Zn-dependent dehydrogenase